MTLPNPQLTRWVALVTELVRAPSEYGSNESGDFLIFEPTLTPAEQAIVDNIKASLDSPITLTVAEWDAIRPELQSLRGLRQMGRNAFMALTAAERDRLIYDALTSQTIIDLAILRD